MSVDGERVSERVAVGHLKMLSLHFPGNAEKATISFTIVDAFVDIRLRLMSAYVLGLVYPDRN
jgi:hypothetical protein